MVINLKEVDLAAIYEHAVQLYPRECCGLLLGKSDGNTWNVEKTLVAKNLNQEHSQDRYLLDPTDRLRGDRLARELGLSVIGFYHSHPDHDVYFSKTDLENSEEFLFGEPWVEPTYCYLVVSIYDRKQKGHGAFIVRNGIASKVDTKIELMR